MKAEHTRRDDIQRRRIEKSVADLMAEGSCDGNVAMVRLNHIRLAALRFAYEGTSEQRHRLALFDGKREQGAVDPLTVAKVVYGDAVSVEALQDLFGVAWATPDEADFFVSNVSADAWDLQQGEETPGAPRRCSDDAAS
jgi:hypothetical protein